MKKFVLLLLLFSAALTASAQKLRLNAYSSYVFDDGYTAYFDNNNYYSGKIAGGLQWGAGLEYFFDPSICVELMYLRRDATAPTTYQAGLGTLQKQIDFDLSANYILLGSDFHAHNYSGKLEGYGGIFGGVAFSDLNNPENGNDASATKFALGLRFGGNIWVTKSMGIKLQTQLISTVHGAGGAFYFGSYPGGVALSSYSTVYQFGVGGGLTFKLGKK